MLGWIITGAIGGWGAGYLLHQDTKFDLFDLLFGIGGAIVGGLVFGLVGLGPDNFIGEIIAALVGAVILTYGYEFWRKSQRSA